ncbi:MAG: SDR family oxidoreductase [Chloroflexota bacterium]
MSQTILVTGASGHLGRRVVELLLEARAVRLAHDGAGPLIAATRSPEKLADLAERGVEVRQADFDRPETLTKAFAGADRLLFISTDAVDGTDRRIVQHGNAVNAAEQAGVKHVVYTSLTRPEPGTPIAIAPDHYATEQALAASSLDWTVLRNNVYTDYLLQSLPQAVATGQLVAAAGDGATAYVTREDCARAAAAVLAASNSGRATLDITGPELVTQADLAQITSDITGQPVVYVPVTAEVKQAGLVAAGLPEFVAGLYVTFDLGIAAGALAVVSRAVADLTGQAPQSVRDFLAAHQESLVALRRPTPPQL